MKPHRRHRRHRRRRLSRADADVSLPTELVLEILSRATPSTAVRCAATCRPWFRLVSRRSFARRASRPRRALLLGFFAFDHTEDDAQATLPPRFVGGSDGGWRCPCVPRLGDDPRFRDMLPVLSRNGYLVLSRANVLAGAPTTVSYCVCNPSTGFTRFLPPFRVHDGIGFWEYGCALLTGRDLNSCDASSFELVVAGIHGKWMELLVDSFSTGTMTWTTSTRCLEIPCRRIAMVDEHERQYRSPLGNDRDGLEMHPKNLPAVLDDGVIHWQCSCDDGTRVALALNVRAWDVELLDLPDREQDVSRCSGTYWDLGLVLGSRSDGVLCAFGLAAENGLVLQRWSTLKRGVDGAIRTGGRTWHRSGDINLRQAISGCNGGGNDDVGNVGDVKLLWYCEKSNVLVFNTVALGNFALDLETERAEALEEIRHCKSEFCARNACVWWRACPYEIDCPPTWITPS